MRRHANIEVPTDWAMYTPEGDRRVTDLARQVTDDLLDVLEDGASDDDDIDRVLANFLSGYIAFFSDDDMSGVGDSMVMSGIYRFYVTLWTATGRHPVDAEDAYAEQYDRIYRAVYDEDWSPYSEKYASVETERADLATPILRLMYEDIQQGELTRPEVERSVEDYVDFYLDEALEKPEEFFETNWDLLRDVLHQAAREQLQRSMTAGVEANWNLLDAWLESDAELA